jgi:hypothetical protein
MKAALSDNEIFFHFPLLTKKREVVQTTTVSARATCRGRTSRGNGVSGSRPRQSRNATASGHEIVRDVQTLSSIRTSRTRKVSTESTPFPAALFAIDLFGCSSCSPVKGCCCMVPFLLLVPVKYSGDTCCPRCTNRRGSEVTCSPEMLRESTYTRSVHYLPSKRIEQDRSS